VLDPENRIINGAFDFWQRGTSFTASAYGADRWINGVSGGTVTMSRQSFTVGDTLGTNNPTYFLRQTVSGQTLSSSFGFVQQRMEGVRSYAGQTITVLGWARRSSGTGNMAVEMVQTFGTGGSPSSDVTGTGQTVTLTTSFAPFALTFTVPSITGKTLGTNGNDYINVNFWTSAGSDFNARTNSLGLQTIGVDLWGIHIKVGTHTTAAVDLYKQPELGPELARCQRYLPTWSIPLSAVASTGLSYATTAQSHVLTNTVITRTVPTGITVDGSLNVTNGAGGQIAATVTFSSGTLFGININCVVASGLTAGQAGLLIGAGAGGANIYGNGCEL
jgi:hypothetical protein